MVKVKSVEKQSPMSSFEKITFQLTDVMRNSNPLGDPPAWITLIAYGEHPYIEGSEWILIHDQGGIKGRVGWPVKRDCEWLPIQVTHGDNKIWVEFMGPLDKRLRELLASHH